ncbi:iron-containing alcohol dehydrogenase [Sneathiella sp.]|uniref:iron-containing alcohol dehydrogenase n=1 Tax=Sneathiella sp. TaxID=1964365 RepID=UPI002633526D|nr:iron-containing alcohol dehydrogenase [Sneathiella sp.]MDF2366407.1 iron-containing alcohol dehydrogenase [Sneathiella sp.]
MTEPVFPDMANIKRRLTINQNISKAISDIVGSEANPRILVSISRSLAANSPVIDELKENFGEKIAGVVSVLTEHTPYGKVFELAKAISESEATHLLSVGGGSVIDGGKIALLVANLHIKDAEELEALTSTGHELAVTSWPIKHIAVPTTLSGAEFTPIAGATSSITNRKTGFSHAYLLPDHIILSSTLSKYTPERLWLSTGIRAVDHAVETVCAPGVDPEIADFCLKGLSLLYTGMQGTKEDPESLVHRANSQLGVYYSTAGISRYRMGASHGLGYLLGVIGHVPHGVTSCVFLPAVLAYNLPETGDPQAKIAKVLGVSSAEDVSRALKEFIGKLGLPNQLSTLGISDEAIAEIKSGALTHPVVQANPRAISSVKDVAEIMRFSG